MHIAVAGVKDIGDLKPVLARQFADHLQRIGQFAHRHRAIKADVIAQPPHGAKGRLAPLPDRAASSALRLSRNSTGFGASAILRISAS